jgi:hypothetical protein
MRKTDGVGEREREGESKLETFKWKVRETGEWETDI